MLSLVSFYFVFISLISFRFVFVDFVSSSLISFRFISFLFRFALYRYPPTIAGDPVFKTAGSAPDGAMILGLFSQKNLNINIDRKLY